MTIQELTEKLRKDFIDSEPLDVKLKASEFKRGVYVGHIEIIEAIEAMISKKDEEFFK